MNLEAASAKNEADVATTMNALAATTAAHATTVAAVAEIGTVVTDAVEKNTQLFLVHLRALKAQKTNDLHVDHYHIVTQGHCFSSSSSRRTHQRKTWG